MKGVCAALVGVVSSSKETWSFGKSFGASLGGAFATLIFSSDKTSVGGSEGGAATFCGIESRQLEVARHVEEVSKPGAS